MYDILQLNDMLVPELLDIAEQLKILNAKNQTNRSSSTRSSTNKLFSTVKVPRILMQTNKKETTHCENKYCQQYRRSDCRNGNGKTETADSQATRTRTESR